MREDCGQVAEIIMSCWKKARGLRDLEEGKSRAQDDSLEPMTQEKMEGYSRCAVRVVPWRHAVAVIALILGIGDSERG